ncbi:MAG: pyridoxal phosphate-dependent aminotransferase [Pseudomonadota bacterium]
MDLAERISSIKPSPTLAINAKAQEMKRSGVDVVNFGVGEPDFDTPLHIRQAAIEAIEQGFTRYTPVGGIDELKDAIIDKFKLDNSLEYERSEILVSCGGKHVLYNLAQAFLNPGDEVIIPAPYWVSYPPIVLLAGGVPVIVETDEASGFKLSPEALEKAITPKTKLLIMNSPSNPTGSVYRFDELKQLAEVILKYNVYVISDDIYERLLFDGLVFSNIAQVQGMRERTFVANGVSKSYAMTGWRIGYIAGAAKVIAGMQRIQSQSTSNPNSIAQKAAVAAFRGPQGSIEEMINAFDERRRFLIGRLKDIPHVSCTMPEGAFYAFPNFSHYYNYSDGNGMIQNSARLAEYFLTEGKVALVPGSAFGADPFIRFSFATNLATIGKGIDRISESLLKLRS